MDQWLLTSNAINAAIPSEAIPLVGVTVLAADLRMAHYTGTRSGVCYNHS